MTAKKTKQRIWINIILILGMMVIVSVLPAKIIDLMTDDDIFDRKRKGDTQNAN